jgi:hypothetical protein
VPSSSFDTFFACAIIVMAVLVAMAFFGSTLQARIERTVDTNSDSYLSAIANRIVTSAGSPADWGKSSDNPSDLGLACNSALSTYDLDIDKISRLNNLNVNSLSYIEMGNAAKLTDIALAVSVSQVMTIDLQQTNTYSLNDNTYFGFAAKVSIDSQVTDASVHGYVVASDFFYNFSCSAISGNVDFTVHLPSDHIDNALLIVFARANFNERMTSFAVYNFADSSQQISPVDNTLSLSPQNYILHFNSSSSVNLQGAYALSYSYNEAMTSTVDSQFTIPEFVDKSPIVLVVLGLNSGRSVQDWTAYPQVPLTAGSNFNGSQRNVFSYMVTIGGVLYCLQVSLGGLTH